MNEPRVTVVEIRGNTAELRIDGRTAIVPFLVQGTRISFVLDGETYVVETAKSRGRGHHHRDHSMSAPMPGVVLKVFVAPGQEVKKGSPLMIREAMKMEHVIAATRDGVVQAVNCREGELVQPGVDLIELAES